MLRKAVIPLTRTIRCCQNSPVKFTGQTPRGFVHDGWANARTPFNVRNKWLFAAKAIFLYGIVGFWAPFIVVEYQMKKANQ
ncbi:cytochrome c oxidase subunit VIIc [Oesophagostomum dentatum]|uniref:Cytochrome c oxidase subunit VIIc n=1 Tax=Oesophagostomum dentatum TaxID=61180 RepID=A0A0B1SWI1_OESDE|nr:cytochrome c oxidase subunit VIIc [Oesophagostomum dentatum]